MVLQMDTMEITTNKPLNLTTLQIVKEGFEEQKNVHVVSIYEWDNNIYGIYINNPIDSLSFSNTPLTNMHTDIDGHNIFMMELGLLLILIYQNGSMQMFNLLHGGSNIKINDTSDDFAELMQISYDNPPLQLSSFHLINWIDELNNGNLNMSTIDLIEMVENFMLIEPLDVDVSDKSSEALMKNNLNLVKQELKSKNFKKITETTINAIDKLFIKLQLDLYITDDK